MDIRITERRGKGDRGFRKIRGLYGGETGRRGQRKKKQAVRLEETKDDLQKAFRIFKDREQVKCPLD